MELRARNKAAFGLGAFGKDLVYMLVSNYLLYYYNAVLGMDSVFIGAVLMGARIFDALNDPLMGIIVAKTRTKWGRYRPWVFAGTVLNALTIYALFAAPASMADSSLRVWLGVIYILWGVTYTMMDIPFWSLIPAITDPGKEREQLSSLARSCSGIGDAVPMVATMVIVPILSGSNIISEYRLGFRWWALIIAVIFVITEIIFVLNVPEREIQEVETVGVGHMFKSLFRNDQALTVVVAVIFVYTALNIVGNLILYFFTFDVGDEGAYSIFVAGCFLAQVVTMLFVPAIRKKVEKMKLFTYGILLQVIGFIVLLVLAYSNIYKTTTWYVLLIPGILVYVGYGILTVMLTIFLADSVDYGELKNGTREESVIFSMQTFTVKLASGIAIFLAGIAISQTGLDTEALVQTQETLNGLRVWMTIPSMIILVLALFVFMKFYKLGDRRMAEISARLGRDTQE
ncbi:MAG: glycoside-pentoside-hexuronide (GPH):cation symporter [Lachnospiraceae bacterium]|nr:glycoside-pentoside-hexuronide (GPH):cation symporter [Lachnospiraceae bacterium]